MANAMMAKGSQGHPPSWKAAMVPISPMEQPSKHQLVLTEARRQCRSMIKGQGGGCGTHDGCLPHLLSKVT